MAVVPPGECDQGDATDDDRGRHVGEYDRGKVVERLVEPASRPHRAVKNTHQAGDHQHDDDERLQKGVELLQKEPLISECGVPF